MKQLADQGTRAAQRCQGYSEGTPACSFGPRTVVPDESKYPYTADNCRTHGVQSVFIGPAQDAANTTVLASTWHSYESVVEFVRSEPYAQFFEELKALTTTEKLPATTHCYLSNHPKEDLEVLFTAKAIEMAPLTLFGDKVHQHYINFETAGKMIAAAPGYVAQFQAPQIEAPYNQWSLVGWDSIELHHAFNDAPEFPDFLKLVAPNVNLPGPPPIIHASFTKVFGSL
ncbi:hypothetical protein LTR13_005080 [Exophiala sideris]|nr:hypothetical protein LTR13_005080 [Exophiala sideris]KAK5182432.1 hypothetical protein LTR44_005444 [Eurotiomycetes sp. CCFEE 6388]